MLVLRSKPQGPPGFSPHIRSISKPHWFYFPNVPRICPLFTTLSATTLTGPIISCLDRSNHLLPVLSDPLLPTSHPAPLSKSDLPRRLEGACEHPSRHVPLLGPFHGSHLTLFFFSTSLLVTPATFPWLRRPCLVSPCWCLISSVSLCLQPLHCSSNVPDPVPLQGICLDFPSPDPRMTPSLILQVFKLSPIPHCPGWPCQGLREEGGGTQPSRHTPPVARRGIPQGTPWKKSHDKPGPCTEKQRHPFVGKDPYSQSYGFSRSHVWM